MDFKEFGDALGAGKDCKIFMAKTHDDSTSSNVLNWVITFWKFLPESFGNYFPKLRAFDENTRLQAYGDTHDAFILLGEGGLMLKIFNTGFVLIAPPTDAVESLIVVLDLFFAGAGWETSQETAGIFKPEAEA